MEKLINVKELGEALGISRSTINKWRRELDLPFYKVGKAVRFKQQEVEAWLRRQNTKLE